MGTSGESVAILIPCYDECLTIGRVVDDFSKVFPGADVYVYDNNSTDGSGEVAREHGATVVPCPIQGKGAVVKQMFREIDADYYLMVDGDGTYPVEFAPLLLRGVQSGECDMAIGDRLSVNYYSDNKRQFHGFGNFFVRFLVNWFFRGKAVSMVNGHTCKVLDIMTGYRAFSQKFVKEVDLTCDGFEVETEMTILALKGGYQIGVLPVKYLDRPPGSYSKLSTIKDGIRVVKHIFVQKFLRR